MVVPAARPRPSPRHRRHATADSSARADHRHHHTTMRAALLSSRRGAGSYNLQQLSSCSIAKGEPSEFELRFKDGSLKELRASSAAAAKRWVGCIEERRQWFSDVQTAAASAKKHERLLQQKRREQVRPSHSTTTARRRRGASRAAELVLLALVGWPLRRESRVAILRLTTPRCIRLTTPRRPLACPRRRRSRWSESALRRRSGRRRSTARHAFAGF